MVAPATLLPMAGGAVVEAGSFAAVFALSLAAALLQFLAGRPPFALPSRGPGSMIRLRMKLRRRIARSWMLSRLYYRLRGARLVGRPDEEVWYFAFGANMHDSSFRERRGMQPREWRAGRLRGYRLRFNLEGRPIGGAAPANLFPDPAAEIWGVLYAITRAGLVRLDMTEGVPGRRYRHLWVEAEDNEGRPLRAVSYIADGKEIDGNPSLRYLTLLREGARVHGLPEHYLRFLDEVKPAGSAGP